MKLLAFALVLATGTGGCSASTPISHEPVLGGPCEGCEAVFVGMPDTIGSTARIAPIGEPGAPMVIEGTVRSADGKPAPGVIVYGYHTDAKGIYPSAATRHGRLRGWARTDATGHYRFETIRPGAYPGNENPEHVHMHVIEPGRGTYWIDELVFRDDPILTPDRLKYLSHGRGGKGDALPKKDERGVWQVRRDITLGEKIPGY